jgi:general secretion pathway protein C
LNENWRNRAAVAGRRLRDFGGDETGMARHAPMLVSLGLIIAIAWVLASLTWLVVPQPRNTTAADTNAPPAAARVAQSDAARQAARVAELHLFGRAHGTNSGKAPNAPETNLNITLRGIIAANDPKFSRALIVAGGGKGKTYAVDAGVTGGAKVHAIYPDRVILAHNGQLETLKLPHSHGKKTASSIKRVRAASPKEPPPGLKRSSKPGRASAGYVVPGTHGMLRADRAMIDGKMQGYRVFPGKDPSKFVKAGLRPGDIIKSINGKPLSDPRAIKELTQQKKVKLTVVRHGQARQISVSLPQ